MKQAVGLKAKASTARTRWAAGLGGVYIWLRIYKRGSNAPILQLSKNSVVRPKCGCRRLFRTRCLIAGAIARIQECAGDYTARTQRPLNHVRDFLDCIRSRRLTVANPNVMYQAMKICLAADICEQLKRSLKFDLRKAEFVGDPEANRLRSRAMRAPYIG